MNLTELKSKIKAAEVDTVVVVFPDLFGRLVGKRFTAKHFLESVAGHGTHGCNYLLTVNIEMDPMDGFNVANWEKGFGDFEMRPDMTTLRRIPWLPGTAMVICDYVRHDGTCVPEAPRSVLRRQVEALRTAGYSCNVASELEFFLFNNSYHEAYQSGYRGIVPASDYRIDYHTMQPALEEPLMRGVRNMMSEARVPVESSKGEWGRGQHEINFVYDQPLPMADMHVVFKQGIKEIAAQHGRAITFMSKLAENEVGSSCHIHASLWKGNQNVFWDRKRSAGSKVFRQFLGGLMKYSPELCYFFAPTINAYKRYQTASWAPTKMAWAFDNRTVGFRVVGANGAYRIENRMPGADANPYLAFAATIAAGLAGIKENLDCGEVYGGNAYVDPSLPALPKTLRDAVELLDRSPMARQWFGDDVIDFYVHSGRLEVQAFQNAVTDWERIRYFERI